VQIAACSVRAGAAPRRALLLAWVLALLALAACGAGAPDAERGRRLYTGEIPLPNDTFACIQCHPVLPGENAAVLGPNLSNIGNRAGSAVPGQSAEAYLRESIVDPDAYLSGGFQEGIHPREYKDLLSDADVADLIAYMLTLKSGQD
jgi:cytochrome c2